MPIIAILNPKGGSGKTTITTNLSRALHERGHKVLIVDSEVLGAELRDALAPALLR